MSATTRNWIFFWLAALLLAGVARYFGPGRVLLTFGYGQTAKGLPVNVVISSLILGIAILITLSKLWSTFHRAN